MEEMLAEHASLKSVKIHGLMDLFLDHNVRWQLLTILVTFVTLQLCGINAVSHKNAPENDWSENAYFIKTHNHMPQSVHTLQDNLLPAQFVFLMKATAIIFIIQFLKMNNGT